jgi:hypothetical protein
MQTLKQFTISSGLADRITHDDDPDVRLTVVAEESGETTVIEWYSVGEDIISRTGGEYAVSAIHETARPGTHGIAAAIQRMIRNNGQSKGENLRFKAADGADFDFLPQVVERGDFE